MRLVYTKHALERMLTWRNVSREMVSEAVTSPDRVDRGRNGALIATKTINLVKVKVVYIEKEGAAVVITVMTR